MMTSWVSLELVLFGLNWCLWVFLLPNFGDYSFCWQGLIWFFQSLVILWSWHIGINQIMPNFIGVCYQSCNYNVLQHHVILQWRGETLRGIVHIQNFCGLYSVRMWKHKDQKNSYYGHFSYSGWVSSKLVWAELVSLSFPVVLVCTRGFF